MGWGGEQFSVPAKVRRQVRLCIWLLIAATAADARGDEPAAAAEGATFARAGRAFLKKHCDECHGDDDPEGSLSITAFRDELSVIKGRKTWLKMLQRIESGEMPPEEKPRPSSEESKAFASLIRGLFERYDRSAKPDPGRVTIRRLNRTEYNNTVRDLIGVDFNPAEDFPSDDIGHGFDNIGDVLTLSPVLMERYLAAAESIVNRAILPVPPPPPKRFLSAKYAEPGGAKVAQTRFRPMSTKMSDQPTETGPFHTLYKVPADGEYQFRVKVYGEAPDGQPVRVALLAHGTEIANPAADDELDQLFGHSVARLKPCLILRSLEVTARDAAKAETIECKVPANIGLQRLALALYKTPDDKPVTLHVEWFNLEGPLDTRPASQHRLLAPAAGLPESERTRAVLTPFVTRAYRRPATADEVARLSQLVDAAVEGGEPWEAGLQRALMAVLVSPKFLFRVELDDRPEAPERRPINEFQLASRLSYFLWSTMPDDELLDLATKNQLGAQLGDQVRRMLKDPKAQALVENFGLQWLQLQRLNSFAPDPKLFPQFNESLRKAMLQETVLFMSEIVREDRRLVDLLDADFTYLNEPLARHYGISDTQGNRPGQKMPRPGGQPIRGELFTRVSLADGQRGGLPTQAGILSVTSNPTRTSPVKRGKWILEQILGDPPPPPPPNVPELAEGDQQELKGTLRQRMEQHRQNPACAQCHARMDPIGFAFENYNAIGAWRTKDGEFPLETAGALPDGTTFEGPVDFKQVLKGRKAQFTRCLTEKLLTYALGRGLEYYDRNVVDRIQIAVERGDDRISVLITEIVNSEPFRFRRGLEPDPAPRP